MMTIAFAAIAAATTAITATPSIATFAIHCAASMLTMVHVLMSHSRHDYE